jgi:hypothetical protein
VFGVLDADSFVVDEVVIIAKHALGVSVGHELAALKTLLALELFGQRVARRTREAKVAAEIADGTEGVGAFKLSFFGACIVMGKIAAEARETNGSVVIAAGAVGNLAFLALVECIEAKAELTAAANRGIGLGVFNTISDWMARFLAALSRAIIEGVVALAAEGSGGESLASGAVFLVVATEDAAGGKQGDE